MRFRVPVSVLIAALVFVSALAIPVTAQTDGIPASIRAGLQAGGVGLVWGFYDTQSYNPRQWDADLPRIRAMGAGHVRIYISWDIMFGSPESSTIVDSRYQDLVALLERIKNAGLVGIVDFHNTRQRVAGSSTWNEDYMVDIGTPGGRDRHIAGLSAVAGRLHRDADTNWFVFQPANEPIFGSNPDVWYNHQRLLLPALRSACPTCVIFATSHDWQGIEAMVWRIDPSIAPYNDPRLIFDVHFYEPLEFTHCGYTSSSHSCNQSERSYPGWITTWRGRELWDANLLRARWQPLIDWARRYNVVVHTSEIGVFKHAVGRTQYFTDLTTLLRQNSIGFTVHDWPTGNFGISDSPAVIQAIWGQSPAPTAAPNVGTSTPRPTNTPAPTSTPRPPTATATQQSTIAPTATATVSAGFDPVAALTEMRDLRAQQDALRERITALRQQLLAWIQGE